MRRGQAWFEQQPQFEEPPLVANFRARLPLSLVARRALARLLLQALQPLARTSSSTTSRLRLRSWSSTRSLAQAVSPVRLPAMYRTLTMRKLPLNMRSPRMAGLISRSTMPELVGRSGYSPTSTSTAIAS